MSEPRLDILLVVLFFRRSVADDDRSNLELGLFWMRLDK